MKSLFILSIFLLAPITDIDKIARTNDLKKKAKTSFNAGNYEEAASKYHYLLDSMGINEPEIIMNLANAYFHKGDTSTALNYYNQLRENENKNLASKACQQLGVIKNRQKKKEDALSDFKQALRNDPTNEEARYNYELLKKILDEEKEQQENKNDKKEPSEWAKQLKKQADQLASRFEFNKAYNLMNDGLKQDPTVSYYDKFIQRLGDVVTIQKEED